MLESWRPVGTEELLEDLNETDCDAQLNLWVHSLHGVERNGVFRVHGIEIDHILHALLWNVFDYSIHEVSMWVHDAHSFAVFDVFCNEELKELTFACA